MGKHAERRSRKHRRRVWSVRVRVLLCLGLFLSPAAVGTMAYWTDEATIRSGSITSGTLDLTVGATEAESDHLQGPGGEFAYSQMTIGDLVPGESVARPFVVRNFGNVPYRYNAQVFTENDQLSASPAGLRIAVFRGGAATNTGTTSAGDRRGSCPGGTSVINQLVSTATVDIDIHGTDQTLQPGVAQPYCAVISLDPASPNSLQGKITALVIALQARQLGAP